MVKYGEMLYRRQCWNWIHVHDEKIQEKYNYFRIINRIFFFLFPVKDLVENQGSFELSTRHCNSVTDRIAFSLYYKDRMLLQLHSEHIFHLFRHLWNLMNILTLPMLISHYICHVTLRSLCNVYHHVPPTLIICKCAGQSILRYCMWA